MIEFDLTYGYKGASCVKLKVENVDFGHVNMINDYGEVMFEYVTVTEMGRLIRELDNGQWA